MNKKEALQLIKSELAPYRELPYQQLVAMIKQVKAYEITSPSGTRYQIEIQVFWDSGAGGNIRISGSIDDGGIRAFFPLTTDFIKSSAGEFVGE